MGFCVQCFFHSIHLLERFRKAHSHCFLGMRATSPVKVICIAGPTSSGKTTFSNKLCMYLRNAGIVGQPLSIDDYYLPLEDQPKYKARKQLSDIDFDAPESLDWDLVHEHIKALTSGK